MADQKLLSSLSSSELNTLVEHLLDCRTMQDEQRRQTLIDALPAYIRSRIERSSEVHIDVRNILTTCGAYPEGLASLIEQLRFVEDRSYAMIEVESHFQKLHLLPTTTLTPATTTNQPTEQPSTPRFSASTIDPEQAQAKLAELPLDTIPDVAKLPAIHRLVLQPNPLFTGRDAELQKLATALKGGSTAVVNPQAAVTGLGGIGKTQLAVEFAHRYGQYFQGGVFWLNFADPNNVRAEIGQCSIVADFITTMDASTLPIDQQINVVQQEWNKDIPRLLIFDNCEDEKLIEEWRPKQGGCRVLVTSRRTSWTSLPGIKTVSLEVLERQASIDLLQSYFADKSANEDELRRIAELVGDLPLALHLSGSYLAEYRGIVTPADYIRELQTENPMFVEALSEFAQEQRYSPTEHDQHVARTFAVSYQRLDLSDPRDRIASAILIRAAQFAPNEPIPSELLFNALNSVDAMDRKLCVKATRHLANLGLLEQVPEGVRLHRLLAAFAQVTIKDEAAQCAVELSISKKYGNLSEAGYPPEMKGLEPHLRWITDKAKDREDLAAADLCSMFGYHLYVMGQYQAAESYLKRSLDLHTQLISEPDAIVALSINRWGVLLTAEGNYEEAQRYIEQALQIRERVLGAEHLDTAMSLNYLGDLLRQRGRYTEARRFLDKALAIREQTLGPDHPDTATSLSNLAILFHKQENFAEAKRVYEQALLIRERRLGANHTDTATSLNNLASLLEDQGDSGAEPLYQRSLFIKENTVGPNHPDTAIALTNLANIYRDQGKYADAVNLYKRALAIQQQVLRPDHPNTSSTFSHLGAFYFARGQYGNARPYAIYALDIRKQALGLDHPDTASSYYNLGKVHEALHNRAEAQKAFEQAYRIANRVFGPNHKKTKQYDAAWRRVGGGSSSNKKKK